MLTSIWNCPVCGSPDHRHFRTVTDRVWVGKGYAPLRVHYAICMKCGLVFQWEAMTPEKAEQYYGDGYYRATVQGGDPRMGERVIDEQTKRADKLMEFLGDLGRIRYALDIGSSTGIWLKELQKAYNCKILGVEMNARYREESGVPAVRDISEIESKLENKFDFITLLHTLEHVIDPVQLLRDIRAYFIRLPGGRFLVEVPDMHRELACRVHHPVCYTQDTLRMVLQMGGWHVKWIKRYPGFKETTYPVNLLAMCSPGKENNDIGEVDIKQIYDDHNKYQPVIEKETKEKLEAKANKEQDHVGEM